MTDGALRFGYDGDAGLGERLLAAVLRGEKTATSSLTIEYLSGDPLPRVGQRLTLLDQAGRAHGIVETTRVMIVPLHLVGDDVAQAVDQGGGSTAVTPATENPGVQHLRERFQSLATPSAGRLRPPR